MKQARRPIAAYADTAGARRATIAASRGRQPGDPVRGAEAILGLVDAENPPRNLVLGRSGVDRVREKLRGLLGDIDAWEALSLGADYPPAAEGFDLGERDASRVPPAISGSSVAGRRA